MTAPAPLPGSLEEVTLAQVLRPLVSAGRTGHLRVTHGRSTKIVYISEGRLIFATSTDPDDRLGALLLRKGLISYRALEDSVNALSAGKRQGTILVENGAIHSRDLVEGLTDQVREIIYGLFAWDEGEYEFVEGVLPSREVIVLRMSTEDLILEGVRRIRRWSRIRAGVGPLEQRYALAPDHAIRASGLSLREEERSLVSTVDGPLTLEEICALSDQPDFAICRTVLGLWAAGLLDRIPQDAAAPAVAVSSGPPPPPVGREIDKFNERHRLVFDLVTYALRERAPALFERAFARVGSEHASLFEGVAVDGTGELDPVALRRNAFGQDSVRWLQALERLLEVETDLAREALGERKARIIVDGLRTLRQQQSVAEQH